MILNPAERLAIFSSISELCQTARSTALDPASESNRKASLDIESKSHSWHTLSRSETLDDAQRYAIQGWPEGTKKLLAHASALPTAPRQTRPTRRNRWQEQGGELSVDRILTGDYTPYRELVRLPVPGQPRVVLAINSGLLGSESAEYLIWRGAATLQAARMLQAARITTTIVTYWTCTDSLTGGGDHTILVTIKPASKPLNEAAVIGAVGHPATKRVFMHAAAHSIGTAAFRAPPTYSLGFSVETTPDKVREAVGESAGVPVVICPKSVHSESSARAWLETIQSLINASIQKAA